MLFEKKSKFKKTKFKFMAKNDFSNFKQNHSIMGIRRVSTGRKIGFYTNKVIANNLLTINSNHLIWKPFFHESGFP
jgi:hypothetical protein